MEQPNFAKWRLYTDGLFSPDNFVDWGFYYMISAALQRRVWIGSDIERRLYPNQFVILVADPGIGKGIVIKPVAEILKHFHLDLDASKKKMQSNAVTSVDRAVVEEIAALEAKEAEEVNGQKAKEFRTFEKPLLLPVAADATTYEALVKAMAKSLRRINYKEQVNGYDPKMGVYTHSSLCFCLEEISSLFRKRTEDLVHFLIQAYDCGDYTYDTKTQGKDRIKRCCLNFFGGTTPGFMQQTFNDQLLTEGFSSRTAFIYATESRRDDFWLPPLTDKQKQAKLELIDHVRKLTELYGEIKISDEARNWLSEWWLANKDKRANTSAKLNYWYSRKKTHILKLATALHFGERTDMELTIPEFQRAINIFSIEEKRMHLALGLDNHNPLAIPAKNIIRHLINVGEQTKRELLSEFFNSLPKGAEDLNAILDYLLEFGKIKRRVEERSGVQRVYYYVPKDINV